MTIITKLWRKLFPPFEKRLEWLKEMDWKDIGFGDAMQFPRCKKCGYPLHKDCGNHGEDVCYPKTEFTSPHGRSSVSVFERSIIRHGDEVWTAIDPFDVLKIEVTGEWVKIEAKHMDEMAFLFSSFEDADKFGRIVRHYATDKTTDWRRKV